MSKSIVMVVMASLFFGFSAEASRRKVMCVVNNSNGEAISKVKSFFASRRTSYLIKLPGDLVLRLRWSYYTAPLGVVLEQNPNYPWNLPWGTKTLVRTSLGLNFDSGEISTLELNQIEDGAILICGVSQQIVSNL